MSKIASVARKKNYWEEKSQKMLRGGKFEGGFPQS